MSSRNDARVERVLDDVEGGHDVELPASVASSVLTSPHVMRRRTVGCASSIATGDSSMPAGSKPASSAASRKNPVAAAHVEQPSAASVLTDQRQTAPHRGELQLACIDVVAIDAGLVLGVDERGHVLEPRPLGQEDDARLRIAKVDGVALAGVLARRHSL